ncbi:OLC1v1033894C1 [Oldenlandia corymbosa var. corymbosa]|uniref:OLC1v1033894C1 n=1 Tax=Oldenlandia corymbosa var. corymbosa TaxID=529605 RepID=A0AAV1CQ07_OLDCO|nr:OLC1v1033894C1 [Oldenlandia corymbosa var. corymbosa]
MTDPSSDQFVEMIPGLPEEIALECLTRLHYSAQGIAFRVCKRWLRLLRSREFYYHRRNSGQTRKVACLVQALPSPPLPSESKKSAGPPSYGITVYDPISGAWDRIDPIPKFPDGLPLFCQVVSTEGKLFVLGGWDPSSWEPVRDVFKFEFTTGRWTQCADMPSTRSFFAVGAAEGRIFIAGGHDESKNALSSAWVYDVEGNEWTELPRMKEERDECEGVVIGSGFWVVSGYDTESQGGFKSSAEVFDPATGEWTRVEDAWRGTQCPRSCVSAAQNGQLTSWAECDSAVRVGTCGIDLGEVALLTGSPYQGAAHGFFFVDKTEKTRGQNGKLNKMEVPESFSGFVQSGCFVEI